LGLCLAAASVLVGEQARDAFGRIMLQPTVSAGPDVMETLLATRAGGERVR